MLAEFTVFFSLAMAETQWPVLTHGHWLMNGRGCLRCLQIWLLFKNDRDGHTLKVKLLGLYNLILQRK